MLWSSSATTIRENNGGVLIPVKTEVESEFTTWHEGIITISKPLVYTEEKLIIVVSVSQLFTVCRVFNSTQICVTEKMIKWLAL